MIDSGVEPDDGGGDEDETDARPLPTEPPVTDGQAAELVLGAPDFATPATGAPATRDAGAAPERSKPVAPRGIY